MVSISLHNNHIDFSGCDSILHDKMVLPAMPMHGQNKGPSNEGWICYFLWFVSCHKICAKEKGCLPSPS